jgi:hypothetical protein
MGDRVGTRRLVKLHERRVHAKEHTAHGQRARFAVVSEVLANAGGRAGDSQSLGRLYMPKHTDS